jgi:hypothetical protein
MLSDFQSELARHRARLERCERRPASDAFLAAMQETLAWLRAYDAPVAYQQFEQSAEFLPQQSFFSECLLSFAMGREELTYAELMQKTQTPFRKFEEIIGARYHVRYASMAETLQLVDYSACKRYVMIGIGRVPASLLYLHDWTAVPELVGIDNYPEAVAKCRQLLDAYRIDRIKVLLADGVDYDYSDADVIYLGYFANPRADVLARIIRTAKKSAQVILRDPVGTGTLFAERLLPAIKPALSVCAEGAAMPFFMNKHYILRFS